MTTRTAALRLGRWLGPWSSETTLPRRVERIHHGFESRRRRHALRVYRRAGRGDAIGSLYVLPGLHFLGADHPRFDHFCAALADAGILVSVPFLEGFQALRLAEETLADARSGFEFFEGLSGRPHGRPGVFSISFGALPALDLAGAVGDRIGGVVVFGGYAEWEPTLRFCLRGAPGQANDPRNRPVLFINPPQTPRGGPGPGARPRRARRGLADLLPRNLGAA